MSFSDTPAASVSLACCQSLCDLLKELPLPSSHASNTCLAARANPNSNLAAIHAQLESALSLAKQQLSELVFNEVTTATTPTTAMSPLTLQMSLKGVFGLPSALIGQNNHNNCYESNSLETIEPSLRTSLEFDDSLKLIDDCLQNDCTQDDTQDVKYQFPTTETTEERQYSSLGERVKSRQRQHINNETTNRRHEDDRQLSVAQVSSMSSVSSVNSDDRNDRKDDRRDDRRDERRDERREERKVERKEKKEKKEKSKKSCHVTQNNSDLQQKDSLASFEAIVSRLMSDSIDRSDDTDDSEDDNRNDMSFDLRIDSRELNHLMALSSKLKHSNRAKDLEPRLGPKLTSFLSLLTNKMTVWFSKFKESDDTTTADDTQDDNLFWQQLIAGSKMALNLMTARGMSSRVVLFEELLEIVVNFLAHNLNSRTHVREEKKSPKKKSSSVSVVTCATKRQVTQWTELLELLSEYLSQNQSLNDSLVLMITRASQSALFLNSNELQFISIQVLTQIFKNYSKHRSSILEELLQHFHRIPSTKHKNQTTCVLTRLVASLTTCLFAHTGVLTRESVSSRLTECLSIISAFLSSFVKKCLSSSMSSSVSSVDCDLKSLFDHFVTDLLNSLYFPQTISSLLLIHILTKLLIQNLNQKNATLHLKLNSIEFLSNICAKFAKILSEKQELEEEATKTLNQLTQEDDSDDTEDDTRRHSQRLEDVLTLLNQFFVENKLKREKVILCALWCKEQRITSLNDKFFKIMNQKAETEKEPIDSSTAHLFVRNLECNAFSTVLRLFDAALSHVTSSLSLTTNTTQRSRAMKSLSQILVNCTLEKSIELLRRQDLQVAMKSALLDASTSVREATVDLIGRFVLQSQSLELCDKYCDLIGERVLDTGVSVRKRVIRILRDICCAFPEFEKCGELQLKIIKRANDEGEGIRKLVLETVRDLWFKHVTKEDVGFRVTSLLHVIRVMLQSEGQIDSLALLLEQIVKGGEELKCAQLIADHVVSEVLVESPSGGVRQKTALHNLAAMTLVALLSQICPELLVKHVDVLQSLLSLSCDSLVDIHLQKKLIQSLERILVKMANPSPQLLNRLEEDLCKQILQSSALILPNCVKCLSVLIEEHTKNRRLATDLFSKFRQILSNHVEPTCSKPKLLRAVYSLGLFLKHFSKRFPQEERDHVLDLVLQLIHTHSERNGQSAHAHSDLLVCCLTSLGFIVESEPRICLKGSVVDLYSRLLEVNDLSLNEQLCKQVLNNFCNYLSESMATDELVNKQIEWSRESLKTMTSESDDSNSIQSQVIQQYLPLLLQNAISPSAPIRRVACNVVHVIQTGGHVHPLQLVPHLIAMTTDDDTTIRTRADHVLHEIERKFHGFVAMKARAGLELSLQLCARLKCRGFRLVEGSQGDVTSRLSTLYHVICTNRQSRRGFVQQLLRSFEVTTDDDTETTRDLDLECQLMFEMVLFFPFSLLDEVMFILQQLECIQSVNSTHASQLFKEVFGFQTEQEMDDKCDDNYEQFCEEVREQSEVVLCRSQLIKRLYLWLKKVFLVTFLRKLLKEFYLIKDEKLLEYSPNEAKVWEKPVHRRHIETSNLSDCLLRANPSDWLLRSDVTVDHLLEELQRFKSVSLTSNDLKVTNIWIQTKLFSQKPKTIQNSVTIEPETQQIRTGSDDINEEQRKRLLESIRKTQCQVSLVDITRADPQLLEVKKRSRELQEVMEVEPEPEMRQKKNRKEKQKKRRKRVRIESSESEDDSRTTEDDTSDDDFRY